MTVTLSGLSGLTKSAGCAARSATFIPPEILDRSQGMVGDKNKEILLLFFELTHSRGRRLFEAIEKVFSD